MAKPSHANAEDIHTQALMTELYSPGDFTSAILNGLHDQVLLVDRQFRISIGNQAILDNLQLTHDQVAGKYCYQVCFEIDHPCLDDIRSCPARKVWNTGKTDRSVFPYLHRDGTTRWLDVTASPMFDPSGKIAQVILARRDVTAEHVLQDRLSGIQNLGRELVLTKDERKILQVGIDAAKILSHSHEAQVLMVNDEQGLLDVWTVKNGAYVVLSNQISLSNPPEKIQTVLNSGEIVSLSKEKGGNLFEGDCDIASILFVPMRVRYRIIGVLLVGNLNKDGFDSIDQQLLTNLAGQMAIAIENARLHKSAQEEIQVRKQAEEKNEKYAANLELLNDISNQIAAILEMDGVLAKVTRLVKEYFGYGSAAFFSLDVDQQLLMIEAAAGKLSAALRAGEHFALEKNILEKLINADSILLSEDAQEISAAISSGENEHIPLDIYVPIQINNKIFGFLALESDRKDGYDRSVLMILDTMADHLSIAIQNANLYEAEKEQRKLVESSRQQLVQNEKLAATGRLTASLAHEINNPLQALHNSLQLLLSFSLNQQEQQEYLKIAEENVERLIELVRRMLDFSRKPRPEPEIVKINQVVERTIKLSQKYIENRGINLEVHLSPDLPVIYGKPGELQQVFLNLVMNAVDAMSRGGYLEVSTVLSNQNNQKQIMVVFSDTGPGVPLENQDKIFEPFYSTKEHGTGLGLSISYNVIQRHGGQLTYHTRQDKGSKFHVILPVQ